MIPASCGGVIITTIVVLMSRSYPLVGHDFAYFIPRMLDTYLHVRVNGPVVQWYTPTFGGGLPAFFNPQHVQFSIPQILMTAVEPWTAILLAVVITSACGFAALYRFLRNTLRLSAVPSTVGAACFLGNGFFIEHAIVGHVGFLLFPLGAVMLHAATNPRSSTMARASWVAITIALMIHQAGFYLLLITLGSIVVAVPLVYLLDSTAVNWRLTVKAVAFAVPLTAGLVGSKVYAVAALMRHFPREVADTQTLGPLDALVGLGVQLAGGMLIIPVLLVGGFPTQRLDDTMMLMTGASVHLWELDTGLAPVLSVTLVCALAALAASIGEHRVDRLNRNVALAALGLAGSVWVAIELTIAQGPIFSMLKSLPPFSSLHLNYRFAAVFILPLSIAGAAALNRWRGTERWPVAAVLLLATVAGPLSYLALPEEVHRRAFDLTQSTRDHEQIARGERFAVKAIDRRFDYETFSSQTSSAVPYEPIFGYDLETFRPRFHEGAVSTEADGRFNMTDPVGLVFPELTGVERFDLIRTTDRANFERFRNREQPDWPLPSPLVWLNRVAVVTLLLCAGAALIGRRLVILDGGK